MPGPGTAGLVPFYAGSVCPGFGVSAVPVLSSFNGSFQRSLQDLRWDPRAYSVSLYIQELIRKDSFLVNFSFDSFCFEVFCYLAKMCEWRFDTPIHIF